MLYVFHSIPSSLSSSYFLGNSFPSLYISFLFYSSFRYYLLSFIHLFHRCFLLPFLRFFPSFILRSVHPATFFLTSPGAISYRVDTISPDSVRLVFSWSVAWFGIFKVGACVLYSSVHSTPASIHHIERSTSLRSS